MICLLKDPGMANLNNEHCILYQQSTVGREHSTASQTGPNQTQPEEKNKTKLSDQNRVKSNTAKTESNQKSKSKPKTERNQTQNQTASQSSEKISHYSVVTSNYFYFSQADMHEIRVR